MLTEKEEKFLLKTARKAIDVYLRSGEVIVVKPSEMPTEKLTENGACFISLYLDEDLRGCIGSLEMERPLVFDVVNNALNAALSDPRFTPLTLEELPKVRIGISVLSAPERLEVKTAEELLERLVPRKHGLIIQKGVARATFLPMVWKQIPKKEDFLAHLCRKAGLPPDGWKDLENTEFYLYEAQEFSE